MGEARPLTLSVFPFVNVAATRDDAQQHAARVCATSRSAVFAALRQEMRPPGVWRGDSPVFAICPICSPRAQSVGSTGEPAKAGIRRRGVNVQSVISRSVTRMSFDASQQRRDFNALFSILVVTRDLGATGTFGITGTWLACFCIAVYGRENPCVLYSVTPFLSQNLCSTWQAL